MKILLRRQMKMSVLLKLVFTGLRQPLDKREEGEVEALL